LHSTQPALSRTLAELEELLDTRLFERTTKHITLTPSGLVLLQHANRILAEIDGAQQGWPAFARGCMASCTWA
jgi:DNA-binding transcriptional LysR family regulator